ncbi:MAG: nicotinamide-nucleotide amidohydrolase family protein [Rhizobiales bacterium]|nr:nicotinamide-nucleotide amidohydrolase family protein [Hyphomicrobiales bacterium]
MFDSSLTAKAAELLDACRVRHLKLATAESCTGGLVAGVITSIAGASDVFEAGFVTYSNSAKTKLVGVPAKLIEAYGAVSEETARAMADGAIQATGADIALAVTGIAGPGGGSAEKPVGLVHIAAARRGGPTLHRKLMLGDLGREEIRLRSVAEALALGLAQAATGAP